MAISAQKSQGTDFELAPKGRHQAVLVGIKDEGMQPAFDKTKPDEPKISFMFEIAALNEKGEPHSFTVWKKNSSWFSQKTGKMSGLIEMLTLWLDVKASELTPSILDDLELLCGVNARVRLTHEPKQDGSGDRVKMTSIEPWEDKDGALLEPQREWGESGFFPSKSLKDFWAEVKGGVPTPAVAKAATPPRAAPANTPKEPAISPGQLGRIPSIARQKFGQDYSKALGEYIQDGYSKPLNSLTKAEGDELISALMSLKDIPAPDDDDGKDIFDDDEGETSEQIAQDAHLLTLESDTPAPPRARGNKNAQSETGYVAAR